MEDILTEATTVPFGTLGKAAPLESRLLATLELLNTLTDRGSGLSISKRQASVKRGT